MKNLLRTLFLLASIGTLIIFIDSCRNNGDADSLDEFVMDSIRVMKIFNEYDSINKLNPDSADLVIKRLLKEINELPENHKKLSIPILANIGMRQIVLGKNTLGDSLTKAAMDLALQIKDSNYFAIAYKNRGVYFWANGHLDSAKSYMEKSIRFAELNKDSSVLISTMINLASVERFTGNTREAMDKLLEIIDLCENLQKWQYMSDASNNLGGIYDNMGQMYAAMKYYQQSIRLIDEYGLSRNTMPPVNNLAIIYMNLGMDSLAVEQFEILSNRASKANNHLMYITANINIANLYNKFGDYGKAKKDLESLLNYIDDIDFPHSELYITAINALGDAYHETGNYKEAESYQLMAVQMASSMGYDHKYVTASMALIRTFIAQQKYLQALQLAEEAIMIAERGGQTDNIMNLSMFIADISDKKGQINKAKEYYKKSAEISQSLYDTLVSKNTKDVAYLYELRKKDEVQFELEQENLMNEIEMQANNELIQKQEVIIFLILFVIVLLVSIIVYIILQSGKLKMLNGILQEENDFKNNVLSIVSHDIRSPLISLYNLFMLIHDGELPDDMRKNMEEQSLSKVEKTLGLIDNLLSWTRAQMTGSGIKQEQFNVFELSKHVCENEISKRRFDEVELKNNIPPDLMITSDKNIVNLALRNLLSNAFKYTKEGGLIELGAHKNGNTVKFEIRDDGIGIPEDQKNKILQMEYTSSIKGIGGEQGKGIGLTLCGYFLHKIGGKMWFESEEGKGSVFYFRVPIQ